MHYWRTTLAESTGLSYPYISQLETGYRLPSHRALRLLARALDIEPTILFAALPQDVPLPLSAPPAGRSAAETESVRGSPPRSSAQADARWIANPVHVEADRDELVAAVSRAVSALESVPADERLQALQEVQAVVVEGIVRELGRRRPPVR